MAKTTGSAYFRRTGLHWIIFLTLVLGFFTWMVFWPMHLPYQHLGPLGPPVQYLVEFHYQPLYYGYLVGLAVHIAETLYCIRLCRVKGITDGGARFLWVVQTFLFGIFSLSLLIAYKPGQQKKQR